MIMRSRLLAFGLAAALAVVLVLALVFPPLGFPADAVIEIPEGATVERIAQILYERQVIRSPFIFSLLASQHNAAKSLKAGFYQFEKPLLAGEVARRIEEGFFSKDLVKFTVPEGLSVAQLAELASQNLPGISAEDFAREAHPFAGYLFPDTYFVPPQITSEQLIKTMRENFAEQLEPLQSAIEKSDRSLAEIINLAALVEEEASGDNGARKIVAGILWKRLDKKMRLEVDVASSTYEKIGLPSQPIVSPGLAVIKAALGPQATDYWFYLSDQNGKMHYAKTFEEHKQNIAKYLTK